MLKSFLRTAVLIIFIAFFVSAVLLAVCCVVVAVSPTGELKIVIGFAGAGITFAIITSMLVQFKDIFE